MKLTLACAATVLASLLSGGAEEIARTGYLRVAETEEATRLQTGITRFQKDGVTVDLVGAIHIADREYYHKLNQRLGGYERVLFEMVGGEHLALESAPAANGGGQPAEAEEIEFELVDEDEADEGITHGDELEAAGTGGLQVVYSMVSRFLGLSSQSSEIDYRRPHFVHADLTFEEFAALQAERGETVMGFARDAAAASQEAGEPAAQVDPAKLMQAMVSGRSDLVKLEIVRTLGSSADQIGGFAGESVIITDRNRRCIEVLDREIEAGRSDLAIFYGAAHYPDLEERLLERGFRRVGHEWITAWDIPLRRAPAAPETGNEEP